MAEALRFNDEAIQQLFFQYVRSCEDRERHSAEAVRCAEVFDDFCSKHVEGDALEKIEAYTKMTDVAVEFEEGGFMAGFKVAMNLLLADGQEAAEQPQERVFNDGAQITTNEVVKGQHEAANDPGEVPKMDECFITSVQIAELFGQVHSKVMHRIEDRIMPLLDETSKAMFKKEIGKNKQNKDLAFYKLNQAACMMYLEVMEPKKAQFINIAGGYAKLQELMQSTFRTEAIPLPA